MRNTTTAVIVAGALALTACGKSTVDPEVAWETLQDQGVEMPFTQFENQGEIVCGLFEKGRDMSTVTEMVMNANDVDTFDAVSTIGAMRSAYCPE